MLTNSDLQNLFDLELNSYARDNSILTRRRELHKKFANI